MVENPVLEAQGQPCVYHLRYDIFPSSIIWQKWSLLDHFFHIKPCLEIAILVRFESLLASFSCVEGLPGL